MDLDEAADQLYSGSPDEFIQRRKELAAEARRAGDRELVKQIGQLRRPTRSAWLVNLLARRDPDRLQELLELGAALQDAQQRRSGNDLRRLSRERRTMIDALSRQAIEAGRGQDYSPPDAAIQEVAQTLQAALGDPAVAELVRTGRLSQATSYGGFGPQDLSVALAASLPGPAEQAPPPAGMPAGGTSTGESASDDEAAAEQGRRQEAERIAAEAEAAAASARRAADEAETAAAEATDRADELADRIEEARRELRELEATERAAREDARAARRHHQELRQTAADAEQAATRARRQV